MLKLTTLTLLFLGILVGATPQALGQEQEETLRRIGDIATVELTKYTWKKKLDPLAIADIVIRVMDWLETNEMNWEGPAVLITDLRVRAVKEGPSIQINPYKYPHIKIWIQNKDEKSTIMVEKPSNGQATFGTPPTGEVFDLSFTQPEPINRAEAP